MEAEVNVKLAVIIDRSECGCYGWIERFEWTNGQFRDGDGVDSFSNSGNSK